MADGRPQRIAIVGAGPCGLACARELDQLGAADWTVFERELHPGGNAASVVDPQGFTWDLGGHVVFSHFGEFDTLLAEMLGDDVYEHDRSSFVLVDGHWVPYPFQNNLRHLEPSAALECLLGLAEASGDPDSRRNFGSWIEAMFGTGIAHHFMRPYNEKVWATELSQMSADWIAERVSVVDFGRALTSFVLQTDDLGWGPNSTFAFPKTGGTGEIYRRLADRLAPRVEYGCDLVELDPDRLELRFADGRAESADVVVSTMPVDLLVERLTTCPSEVRAAGRELRHTSVSVVGIGYEAPLEDDRSWLYFPSPDVPFYRATNFAKYSPANVPEADTSRYRSYLTESARPADQEPRASLVRDVEAGLVSAQLARDTDVVASEHVIEVDYAYPVPTLSRDAALATIQPWLEEHRIFSRGRFGTWRYEIGNMDHAVKMGIDIARRLVEGRPEELQIT